MSDDVPPAPEPLPELDAAARRIETPCGRGSIAWRSWGEGPPLVLLHGGSGSWRHWGRNIASLARDHRVLAPDTPGLGESAMPPRTEHPDDFAAPLQEGLARILGEDRRYDLCGFSFGALVSGHLVARDGARVRSVTLVGAGALGVPRSPTELVTVRDKRGAARVEAHRQNLAVLMFKDPARIEAVALAIQEWNTQHARFRSRGFAGGPLLKEALMRAAPETRIGAIWGDRDAIAFPHVADRIAVLRGLRADVDARELPDAGHWTAWEQPEAFEAMLREMLGRG